MKALLAALAALLLGMTVARAEVGEIRISRQPGIIYLAVIVMEQSKLIEKNAAAFGVPGLKASYKVFNGGGVGMDALLSDNIDIVTTGVSNMLLLWDRTKGGVKGYASSSATPMWLMSNNPKVKTLADLSAADKIAVPTVKISTQAILLQIAARKLYGDAGFDHFDGMEVTLGHPDAAAALTSGAGLTGHFSGAPYQQAEAANPNLHVVTTSTDIMGGPVSNAVYFGTQKFHDANPGVVKTFLAAAAEADAFIKDHPKEACAMYLAATGEKGTVDELVDIITKPDMFYTLNPVGTLATAQHMADTKVMKVRPASWKDFFFADIQGIEGN